MAKINCIECKGGDIMTLCEWCKKLHSCPEKPGGYMMNNGCKSYIPLFNSISKEENIMESRELVEQTRVKEEADRLKEEYAQLKKRYEKLRAHNIKLEVKANIAKVTPAEEEYYSNRLLARQQEVMADYLKVLELRATLAGIELS